MSAHGDFVLDETRTERVGLSEAVFCASKSPAQIAAILDYAGKRETALLLTRLDEARFDKLPERYKRQMDYDPESATAYSHSVREPEGLARIAVVTAGTSDLPVAREAMRTLYFEGFCADPIADVGVAGLWRLMRRAEELQRYPIIIVVAGMDAALPSVVGGLFAGLIIAVPTSVGYGVAHGGHVALNAILASCTPGIVVVNIDNGYGAACAAIRALGIRKGQSR